MSNHHILFGSAVCVLLVSTLSLLSTPIVCAEGNFTFYTQYSEYDNNETIHYFINGTSDTLYTVHLLSREAGTPLVITYARTDENHTETDGHVPLYEVDSFGWMTLRAFNKSKNQSAETSVRITPSMTWWDKAIQEIIDFFWGLLVSLLYIQFAICMIPITIMGVFFIKYREKAKASSGELTLAERAGIEDLWNYDEYANDICSRNPKVPSERARLKFSTAKNLLLKIMRAKKKMGIYRQLEEKEIELKARLPKLAQDVLDALVSENVITKKERETLKGQDKWRLLNPGQKREEI